MLLYDADWAPSPRRVRVFLAEKGVAVERRRVDLRAGEQLAPAFRAINPRGTVPVLDIAGEVGAGEPGSEPGERLTESAAICRYFEALHPDPPLMGEGPAGIARCEEWVRRIEGEGYAAAVYALRNTRSFFAGRAAVGAGAPTAQIPALADRAGVMWEGFVAALDARLAAGREWIAGPRFGFADITALVTVDFARDAGLPVPARCAALLAWHARAAARPSAAA